MSRKWVILRCARAVLTLLLLISFTFLALSLSADPALQILGPDAGEEVLDAFRKRWGLDQPLWRQYLIYIKGVFQLDLGASYRTGDPAIALVVMRLPATFSLMIPTAVAAIGIGVPLGILAASHRGQVVDRVTMIAAIVSLAIPNFLVGIALMYLFSVKLGWLAPSGIVDWRSYIMPVITMATAEAGVFARFTRSAMVEAQAHPMVDTARASGFSRSKVMRAHAVPNAALPLLTLIGLFLGNLIGGAVVTENVFSWPGTGRLLVDSVAARDFAVVQCVVILIGVTMIVANLLVDLSYAWIDPRLREARS